MDEANKEDRRVQIETAAYGLLALKGYKATSMLEVAKRAKASNETLYKWYGNKQGLFLSMVARNTEASKELLTESLETEHPLQEVLAQFGVQLLSMLTGQRAVVLNRAAAGDVHDTGTLGRTLSEGGRSAIVPLLSTLIAKENPQNLTADEAAEVYLDLLIGDLQIRRVIGALPLLKDTEIKARSDRALTLLMRMIA